MDLLNSQPFKIGVNYWPASTAIQMWSNWNSEEIAADFKQMSGAGIDLVRFFLFTPDFVQDGKVDPQQLEHYKIVLDHLETAGLYGIPTFFIGHMSGQNYRVDGWDDETFFSDPEVLEQQKKYIRSILKISSASKHIAGWCLSNEMSNDFPGKDATEVTTWFRTICDMIHDSDSRPLVIGDGVWSPEITGAGVENNLEPSANYLLRELAPLQDTLGVHFYPRFDDYWPQAYTASFRLLMAKSWKDAVFLEEFGHSITMGSEENQALYYREVLFSALQAGASAALNWCWTDFETTNLRPYLHNTFEMRFGLRRSDGSFRPALQEMQSISQLSKELSSEGWELEPRDSWFIIPSNYYQAFPFDWDRDTEEKYNLYLHTYGALASSGAVPMCFHEPGVEYRAQDHVNRFMHTTSFVKVPATMWLPALKRLSAPFWEEILEYVHSGSILYASFATDHWIVDLDETLGIKSSLRFGLPDYYPSEVMTISSPCSWGPFGDQSVSITIGENSRALGYLPCQSQTAEVLLEDSEARPLLIRKSLGKGYIYFALFPFEVLMTKSCDDNVRAFVTALYAGIREDTIAEGSSCETAAAQFMRYQRNNETREFLFNHAWEQRAFKLRLKNKEKIIKNVRVELPPKSFCEIVDTQQPISKKTEFMQAAGVTV